MEKIKQLYKNLSKGQKLTAIVIILFFILVIVYGISVNIYRHGKVAVTVKFAPYAAKVTLNDVQVSNNATVWLEPGSYRTKVELEHFDTIERTVEISEEYKYIVGTLTANDAEGKEYADKHAQEYADTEGVVGLALNAEGMAIKNKYPILKYLPINNRLYSISYAYTDDNEPIITVKTSPKYLDIAVQKMKVLKNVDLTIYQVNFTPENPFAIYEESIELKPEDTIQNSFENISNYKVSAGQYINDNYYAATIYTFDYSADLEYAHYRILLKKDDNNYWHIVSSPQPLLTQQNTPNTPVDILNSVNSLNP